MNIRDYGEKGNKGISDQQRVVDFIKAQGYVVIDSSPHEDRALDIDCWVRSKTFDSEGYPVHIPVSIKCTHDGAKYDNVALEIDTKVVDAEGNENWTGSSWWQNGQARQYLILQGNELFRLVKADLQEAWDSGIIEPERERTLKAETVESQRQIGHAHIDSKTAFFNRTQLRQMGILKKVGNIDGKPSKSYGSVTSSQFKKLARGAKTT